MEDQLVPGRSCGSCNVCCVVLTIDDPQLQKLQGYRCKNATRDNGCGVYDTRPQMCRTFFCGWRMLKWVREPLRPDVSGVLFRLHAEVMPDGTKTMGVIFTPLSAAALKAEGLAESIAAAVATDIPVYMQVPGRPGYTAGQTRLNDALRTAVITRDKAAVLDILAHARAQGRHGDRERIVLKHGRGGAGGQAADLAAGGASTED